MELHEKIKCEFCQRQNGDCNSTNWKRHVDSCKEKEEKVKLKRKNVFENNKITKFFKTKNDRIRIDHNVAGIG